MSLGEVLGWKFPGVEGIRTKEGKLTGWPDNLTRPTAQDIATWTAEYEARDTAIEEVKEEFEGPRQRRLLKVLLNHENRLRSLERKASITMAQFKTALRNI